jgi:hypothetical protein
MARYNLYGALLLNAQSPKSGHFLPHYQRASHHTKTPSSAEKWPNVMGTPPKACYSIAVFGNFKMNRKTRLAGAALWWGLIFCGRARGVCANQLGCA